MNTSKHTPEPWNIHPHYECEGMVVENESGEGWVCWTAVIGKGDMVIGETSGRTANGGFPKVENGKEVQANADRIIACVNACAGINPEAVPDMLAALKEMLEISEGILPLGSTGVKARAAIAKAESNQ